MQHKNLILSTILLLLVSTSLKAQYTRGDSTYKKCFIGSTLAMAGNLAATNKPDFVQLNLGYRLTHRDAISIELKTWKYAWSLGIPYGPKFEAPEEEFPGYIRERGFALVYQRFLWKGLYTGVHAMSAWQTFANEKGKKIGKGFQLFNTYRLGYHFEFFNHRFFVEPSIAITHRPFHTDMPDAFKAIDNKWSKVFYGEPGLHFGFNF